MKPIILQRKSEPVIPGRTKLAFELGASPESITTARASEARAVVMGSGLSAIGQEADTLAPERPWI
jgi:hypothetical protein